MIFVLFTRNFRMMPARRWAFWDEMIEREANEEGPCYEMTGHI